ncbi:MAG: hypothetical protein HY342_05505 [Candidatus Lambdaproteobacteria bacterium]|nr:hypothetical protein [Candidatus Lambdaproteobacteria bacterium]
MTDERRPPSPPDPTPPSALSPEQIDELERRMQADEAEWNKPESWRFGIFYYSERDSRIWVPKRSLFSRRRSGGTPNLAKRQARLFVGTLLGFFLFLLAVVVALSRAGYLR